MTDKTSKDGSLCATDERVNTCTHIAGAVLSLLGAAHLVVSASVAGKPWHIVAFSLYGLSLLGLFLASILHHGVTGSERTERMLRQLDYIAIFWLIAGTMTPACLVLLRGPLGWTVMGVAWVVAIIGTLLKAMILSLPKAITNTLYLTMGWLALALALPIYRAIGWQPVALLGLGGLLYSGGAAIFAVEKPNPVPGIFGFHEIWHIAVMLGAAVHFIFIWRYILPLP